MIRLLVALVVALALHPTGAQAAHAHERTLVVAGARHAAPAVVDARLAAVPPALAPHLGPPAFVLAAAAAPRSFTAVARLWLRAQRLLC